jgi:hypothetical protein
MEEHLSEPVQNSLVELLDRCACQLAREGAVESPAHVAVIKFDPAKHLNKYVALFNDWADITTHPLHLREEWRSCEANFNDVSESAITSEQLQLFRSGVRAKQISEKLEFIAKELRRVNFYYPLTEDAYTDAQSTGHPWKTVSLSTIHQHSDTKRAERKQMELNGDCPGHWDYGLALEGFYLGAYTHTFYAEYFTRHVLDDNIYVIAAFCQTRQEADQIKDIASIVESSEFMYDVFIPEEQQIENLKKRLLKSVERPTDKDRNLRREFESKIAACRDFRLLKALLKMELEFQYQHKDDASWPIKLAISAYANLSGIA